VSIVFHPVLQRVPTRHVGIVEYSAIAPKAKYAETKNIYFILFYFILCHVMSCHVMSCHVMSCHVMSFHVNPVNMCASVKPGLV